MALREKVERYMNENNATFETVAEKIGVCRTSLFNKMRGDNEFSLSEAFRFSRLLGLSLDEFYAELKAAV